MVSAVKDELLRLQIFGITLVIRYSFFQMHVYPKLCTEKDLHLHLYQPKGKYSNTKIPDIHRREHLRRTIL